MRIDILTLFPETLGDVLSESILAEPRSGALFRSIPIRSGTIQPTNRIRLMTILTAAAGAR